MLIRLIYFFILNSVLATSAARVYGGGGGGVILVLLEELVILLVEANGVLAPELLRLVHGAPFQAAGLEFGAVLVK